ncbi:YkgJ family cysteine cluster protein [Uliginosibacterium gangwonense]|uniref:YkgJ family cysteine cluster protein n=1 Tax=Uliginosibacterium gangwonense TaxID=392736 RepID=UPI0003690CB8|nr:YkgJ family cysteine cluster protein [Uliginosibacterium gangwonense]
MSDTEDSNPCIRCGGCCCNFRVSFYWGEADDAPGGQVPVGLTEHVSIYLRAMIGTHPHPKRCIALEGELGKSVGCSIYPQRPSPCRDFPAWEEDGTPNPSCTQARAKIGLPALPKRPPFTKEDDATKG